MAEAFDGMKRVVYQPTLPKSVRPYQGKEKSSENSSTQKIPEAVNFILRYPVSGVATEDSLYLPYRLATKGYRVRVALPNSGRVKSEYKFQRDHTKLTVGYADDLEIHYSPDDQLVYGTTDHFVKKILDSYKSGSQVQPLGDIFFIPQDPVLSSLVRTLFPSDRPKIVYLAPVFYQPDFPVYQVPSENGEEIFLSPNTPYTPLSDDPNPLIVEIVRKELRSGLILRPGVDEVNKTVETLNKSFSPNDSIGFYPVYGQPSQVELEEILSRPERVKIIVGTNLRPLEDINFVIDDLIEKVPQVTSNGGVQLVPQKLQRSWTFVPRTYKLITQRDYSKLRPSSSESPPYQSILQLIDAGLNPDQILKVPTESYRRVLIKFGLLTPQSPTASGKFVSEIPLRFGNALLVSLGYQRFLNAVIKNGGITQEKVLLRTVIAVASMNEVYGPGFFLPSRREPGQSDAEYSAQKNDYTKKYHQRFIGSTEVHTLVNIFWEMLSDLDVAKKYDQASRNMFLNYLREWSINNKMNYQKIKEFFVVMRKVESMVESMIHLEVDPRTISPQLRQAEPLPRGEFGRGGFSLNWQLPAGGYDDLGNQVAKLFAQAYIQNRYQHQGDGVYLNPETGLTFRESSSKARLSRESSSDSYPPVIIIDLISGLWIPGVSL